MTKKFKSLRRVRQFELDELRRYLAEVLEVINKLEQRRDDLAAKVDRERQAAANNPEFASDLATFMAQARAQDEKLRREIASYQAELDKRRDMVTEGFKAVKQVDVLIDRAEAKEAKERAKKESQQLDEIAGRRAFKNHTDADN